LIAGPNGSGKSTFARQVQEGLRAVDYSIPPIINPDEIARRLHPTNPDAVAGAAAREALVARGEALAARESFSIETTLSGRSELRLIDEARARGYRVTMTFVSLESADENVARVQRRAIEERRMIPGAVVRRRYERSLAALSAVVGRVDFANIIDNTETDFTNVATFEHGRIAAMSERLPAWAERALHAYIALARDRQIVARAAAEHLQMRQVAGTRSLIQEQSLADDSALTGCIVVTGVYYLAVATSETSYSIIERAALDSQPSLSAKVSIRMSDRSIFLDVLREPDRSRNCRLSP
jgi:predicted ABC-type ATPase